MTLRWVPGWNGLTDPDAVSYVAAVEAADGQDLEFGVARAINDFVVGCKNDGIWDAIKACCILAGARTLSGALVPLVGTAPTNFNFVAGDYDRKTGLKGDGSTKYLDSNRNNNADPQDNKHLAGYYTAVSQNNPSIIMDSTYGVNGASSLGRVGTGVISVAINATGIANLSGYTASIGFVGASRATNSTINYRYNSSGSVVSGVLSNPSQTPINKNLEIFKSGSSYGVAGIPFYSIGESLDLAALDTRVTDLINAIGVAIP